LLNSWTTSQNHCTTGEAAVDPVYSVFAFRSSTAGEEIEDNSNEVHMRRVSSIHIKNLTINFWKTTDQ
jgi:hypothetical protein